MPEFFTPMTDVIQYPDTPFPLEPSLVMLGRRGSEAHGTFMPSTDPNSIDDRDLMGICIPPARFYLGITRWEHAEAIKGPWDVVLYEFRKFVGLLMKQNPNVIGMLWLEPEDYLVMTDAGRSLIENRNLFRHRDSAFASFCGYADSQLKKMCLLNSGELGGDFVLSQTERAYAAGIFDGEGHVSICQSTTEIGNECYALSIGITSTDVGLLEYIEGLFGGHTHTVKQQPNRLPAYRWRAQSIHAAEILRCMLPFLRIKYEQATVAIEFADGIIKNNRQRLSDEVTEQRRGLRRQLHNARHLPYMGARRKTLTEKHGYDCKCASHLVRLLHMGKEFLETGEMKVRRTWDRDMLIAIKRGEWSLERIRLYAENQFTELRAAKATSPLPEELDHDAIERLVIRILRERLI